MTKSIKVPGVLDRIWSHALMPLLEEQYYGSEDDVAKVFALSAVRRTLREDGNIANPGTTADLTAAAVFVMLMDGGWNAAAR